MGVKEDNSGISEQERAREGERSRRVLHFAVFYLYHRHTTAQGSKDEGKQGRDKGNGVYVCVCVWAVCNIEINDLLHNTLVFYLKALLNSDLSGVSKNICSKVQAPVVELTHCVHLIPTINNNNKAFTEFMGI